jgi:hypothetical protein
MAMPRFREQGPRHAIVVSPCPLCGQQLAGNATLCARHAGLAAESWAASNRIMCDFFHRGIAPPRVDTAERIADLSRRLAESRDAIARGLP